MSSMTTQRRLLVMTTLMIGSVLVFASLASNVRAASWNGIEPFKSRREDVTKILGQPVTETADGVLRFGVSGGSVQISFVSERFVTAKRLRTELAGTVLEIVLQHEHSSDTAESMNLLKNSAFSRDDARNISIFRNIKDGLVYTFIDGTLKTTRYTFADGQLGRARR